MKNLRHGSLHTNVSDICRKFQNIYSNSKREILVKKIKVKKYFLFIISLGLF